jgi:flavocytochrome c
LITGTTSDRPSLGEKWDAEADVLIVGTGFSGLSAAIEAFDAGADVLLLEKMPTTGGNSIIAGGGVNAVDPERQNAQGIEDSLDLHFEQTFEGGDRLGEPEKIRFMVENASEMCLHWLEKIGIKWPDKVAMGYGALWERTHLTPEFQGLKRGAAIIGALLDQVKKRGIAILLEHKVTRIIREQHLTGIVLGVELEHENKRLRFRAKKAVILASGGFAANLEMVMDHDRRLANTPSSNHRGATGDCIRLAQDIGADVLHMDYIQCVPRKAKPPSKAMFFQISSVENGPSDQRRKRALGAYTIFVNKNGKRFVREDGRRDEITLKAYSQPLFEADLTVQTDTIEELEEKLGIPKGNLVETIHNYNSYCESHLDPDFGKHPNLLIPYKTPPFEAESKVMARHHTMGGLKTLGTTGQVVDRWGNIIPRLYAAGEVTGGFHGANRLGHNATPECIVFGRTVGKLAAELGRP